MGRRQRAADRKPGRQGDRHHQRRRRLDPRLSRRRCAAGDAAGRHRRRDRARDPRAADRRRRGRLFRRSGGGRRDGRADRGSRRGRHQHRGRIERARPAVPQDRTRQARRRSISASTCSSTPAPTSICAAWRPRASRSPRRWRAPSSTATPAPAGSSCRACATPTEIQAIAAEAGLPLNVMAWPGLPAAGELAQLGVRRLSAGSRHRAGAVGQGGGAGRRFPEDGKVRPARRRRDGLSGDQRAVR